MVHYKVEYDVLRAAGMKEEASFQTFCGIDLRRDGHTIGGLHLVGGSHSWWNQPIPSCPTCIAIFQAIANHNLDRGN